MAVKIRLTRLGDKGSPFYRVVATDSRSPRDGKFLAVIGTYNPLVEPVQVTVNQELAKSWLDKGATPTPTARKVLEIAGVLKPAPKNTEKKTKTETKTKKEQK